MTVDYTSDAFAQAWASIVFSRHPHIPNHRVFRDFVVRKDVNRFGTHWYVYRGGNLQKSVAQATTLRAARRAIAEIVVKEQSKA